MTTSPLKQAWQNHLDLALQLQNTPQWWEQLELALTQACHCLEQGGKILFCGNGGSAADAQHLAAELSGRFYYNRPPLNAEALHVNTSYLTAVANDYGYDEVFARMIRACGQANDILIALSTSGNSANVCRAAATAQELGLKVWAWTGASGGQIQTWADLLFAVPSQDTPRIQEMHLLLGHLLCQGIESRLFPKSPQP